MAHTRVVALHVADEARAISGALLLRGLLMREDA